MADTSNRIGASARQVIASLNGSGALTSPRQATDPIVAVERARILAGCYRKDDAADPETYLMALSAVLSEYQPDIVAQVTDPRSGLPSRLAWLPSVKEVHDACEELASRRRRIAEAVQREKDQIADRKAWLDLETAKPSLAELKAKHGETYGLSKPAGYVRDSDKRLEYLAHANNETFAEECRLAGVDPDRGYSPSLERFMKEKHG